MRTITSFIQKAQKLVNGNLLKVFILALIFGAPFASLPVLGPSDARAAISDPTVPGDSSGDAAKNKFIALANALQKIAAVLLVIGCLIAGVMFISGKTDLALKIFAGAIIVFGGCWVIGLIGGALSN